MGEGEYTIRVSSVTIAFGVTSAALSPDPSRVSVAFSVAAGAGAVTVIAQGWSPIDAQYQMPTSGYIEFRYSHWGPLVAGKWAVSGTAAGNVVFITEMLYLGK